VAISKSASPEIISGLGGPEEDHQLHHCCWTGRVSEREEEESIYAQIKLKTTCLSETFHVHHDTCEVRTTEVGHV